MNDKIYDFATERQKIILEALKESGGNKAEAARRLNVSRSAIFHAVSKVEEKARRQGYDPEADMTNPVGEPFRVKGTSTLYDKRTGEPVMQWVKTTTDQKALERIAREVAESYLDSIPKRKPVRAPREAAEDLLTVYPIADPHLGLYVAQRGSETPYDLQAAYDRITEGMEQLINSSPPAGTALIANLGDFFHTDNLDNQTRRSGNPLEVSQDWPDILRCGVQASEFLINAALHKHQKVHVINAIGNHDDHSAYALSVAMDCRYRDDPRVTIDLEFSPHHYFRHGLNFIGVHHGNTTKSKDLAAEMAAGRPKDWGETKYRWWFTGHRHNLQTEEFPGVTVETMRAVCPRNGYARSKGYTALSDMQSIVLHKEHGQKMRNYVSF